MPRLFLICALILSGCSAAETDSVGIPGIPSIESVDPEWGEGRMVLSPDPVVEIGASQPDGTPTFAGLASVRFLESGKIGASDSQANQILVFDPAGAHLATLGRSGQGPGEFQNLARVYPYPGDSVAGFDFGLNRTQIFPVGSGESRALPGVHDNVRAPVLGVLQSGSLTAYQLVRRPGVTVGSWDSTRVILVDRTGAPSSEVARVAASPSPPGPDQTEIVLVPRSFLAAAADGFYWARSDRYEIFKFDSLGTPQFVIRRAIEPERVGAREEAEYRAGTIEGARRVSGDHGARSFEARLRNAVFAPTRPLFGHAFVDHNQRLWVSELPWPSRFEAPRRWIVFSPGGRWLGDIEAPEGVTLHDARDDRVLGLWKDELDLDHVRVYRLLDANP